MSEWTDVVIIGAGPYGLSIATHLKAQDIRVRIFGPPMRTWRDHMPTGMYLKSDGFASNLSDPGNTFTLKHYCDKAGIAYDDTRLPVSLSTFQSYGLAFQKRFVPDLDQREVVGVDIDPGGYRVRLEDGEVIFAKQVILAVGISHFEHLPPALAGLPDNLVGHSAAHGNVHKFRGRKVTVVGAGASASDIAALLHLAGAKVQLVARAQTLKFSQPPGDKPRPIWQRLRHPKSGLGPGLRSRFYTDAPLLFHRLPQALRLKLVDQHLGASGGYTMKEIVVKNVKQLLGYAILDAEVRGDSVHLTLATKDGKILELDTEHVIAATGYHPDLRRLTFLSEAIRSEVAAVENTPILSSSFESSLPGLYFTGLIAANSFGPMLRFAYGADFTARRLARHMARRRSGLALAPTQPEPGASKAMEEDARAAKSTLQTVGSGAVKI